MLRYVIKRLYFLKFTFEIRVDSDQSDLILVISCHNSVVKCDSDGEIHSNGKQFVT